MGFRTIKINSRCKLQTELNYLVYRGETEKRIALDEIETLIIENQQVCITSSLLSELINHKVKVIFCDRMHNPLAELVPYHGAYNTMARIKAQLNWSQEIKDFVWARIIKQKIRNQAEILKANKKLEAHELLLRYEEEVQLGDSTNREGLAAKTYFQALFGQSFERRQAGDKRNKYLDYGYSILLSSFNREITCAGYLPALGIHHIGEENPFNLGCDFMEPFRPFIDEVVLSGDLTEENFKTKMIESIGLHISCNQKKTILENAVDFYTHSVLNALNKNDPNLIIPVTFYHE